jgi:transposase-like protein
MLVMILVERGGGARSVKVNALTSKSLRDVLVVAASRKSALHTDQLNAYDEPGREFVSHQTVNHSVKQYSRRGKNGEKVTTNTVEGYFSIVKRGMHGVYQHCSEKHLPRYLAEFDFRYSNRIALGVDATERAERAIKGAVGRRLTYR